MSLDSSSNNCNGDKEKPSMWLVTGTSSGLGLALAQHILRQRHNLISISRHPKPDDSLVSLASSSPSSSSTSSNPAPTPIPTPATAVLHYIQIDLSSSDPEAIKSPIRTFLHAHPTLTIDVLVNNAGMVRFGPLETITPAAVFETMNTNFYSPLWITQTVLSRMRAPPSSSSNVTTAATATTASKSDVSVRLDKVIVNVSSTQGVAGDPSEVAYDASKHALEGMSKVLAAEVAPFGIRVVLANLGSFRTGFSGKGAGTVAASSSVSDAVGAKADAGAGAGADVVSVSAGGDGIGQNSDINDTSGGDGADGAYGPDHPVAKRIAMVMKYSNVPNAAKGDVDKGASVLFDAVMKRGEVDEALKKQREWSVRKGDGRGRVERLVLGSDAVPKIQGVVDQFAMEVESCQRLVKIVNADDVE